MSIILLNSAMMPCEGTYVLRKVSENEFMDLLRNNEFVSYIGYLQNAQYIANKINKPVSINRNQTQKLKDGDILAIMKLKYRIKDPKKKGKRISRNDYEFYIAEYKNS